MIARAKLPTPLIIRSRCLFPVPPTLAPRSQWPLSMASKRASRRGALAALQAVNGKKGGVCHTGRIGTCQSEEEGSWRWISRGRCACQRCTHWLTGMSKNSLYAMAGDSELPSATRSKGSHRRQGALADVTGRKREKGGVCHTGRIGTYQSQRRKAGDGN